MSDVAPKVALLAFMFAVASAALAMLIARRGGAHRAVDARGAAGGGWRTPGPLPEPAGARCAS